MDTLSHTVDVVAPVAATPSRWTRFEDFPAATDSEPATRVLRCKACHGAVEVGVLKGGCPCGRSTGQLQNDGRVLVVGPASILIERDGSFVEGMDDVDFVRPIHPLL